LAADTFFLQAVSEAQRNNVAIATARLSRTEKSVTDAMIIYDGQKRPTIRIFKYASA